MKPTIHNVATPHGRLRHKMTDREFHGGGTTLCGMHCVNGWVRDGMFPGDPTLHTDRDCPKCVEAEYELYGRTCYFILEEEGVEHIPVAIYRVRHLLSGPAAAEDAIRQAGTSYIQGVQNDDLSDQYELMYAVAIGRIKVPNVQVEKIALAHDRISTLWSDELIR